DAALRTALLPSSQNQVLVEERDDLGLPSERALADAIELFDEREQPALGLGELERVERQLAVIGLLLRLRLVELGLHLVEQAERALPIEIRTQPVVVFLDEPPHVAEVSRNRGRRAA